MRLDPALTDAATSEEAAALREALGDGDAALRHVAPILAHLVAMPDHSLFSDELVARVKGMCHHIARQTLRAQAKATGEAGREAFADKHGPALAAQMYRKRSILLHCHSLALEWQLAARMEAQFGLDPALSPLLQELIAADDPSVASAAMASLAAQARFAQTQRRMELPLAELPGDLFHEALVAWREYVGDGRSDAMIRAEAKLRNSYDEGATRLSLLARLIAGMGEAHREALDMERAGVALFVTALALGSGQSRNRAILSTHEGQASRLALGLRAAGIDMEHIKAEMLRMHSDLQPALAAGRLSRSEAKSLLAGTPAAEME